MRLVHRVEATIVTKIALSAEMSRDADGSACRVPYK